MNAFATVLVLAVAAVLLSGCEAGVLAAAPAAVGYAHAVPQNIPPFASRLDFETRVRAAPFAAFAAPAPVAAFAAPAPVAAFAGAAPVAAFGAPIAPSAPLIAAPASPFYAPAPPAFAPYALPPPFFRR